LNSIGTVDSRSGAVGSAKCLVTGAGGFVGSGLIPVLRQRKFNPVGVVRRQTTKDGVQVVVPCIDERTVWTDIVRGMHFVIHLAARVHQMDDRSLDPLEEFRRVNVAGTLNLARQAAEHGVKRFVFVSSIKVNGEATLGDTRFSPNDKPNPRDPYGVSKCEAEEGLRRLAHETGMEVVIIRPVLVYGPGVKGNFLSMMKWLYRGIPLPLGALRNRRSLVALDNLIDLIIACLLHPAAANQTFLVSDGEDLSTSELLRRTAKSMGTLARLIPVPAQFVEFGARLIGKRDVAQRLCGSLQVDITRTRELLGWSPPLTVDQGLQKTAEHFLEHPAR
jgi:nucleoside-diphosphate-sugar epimerase